MIARTIFTYDGLQSAPNDGLRREVIDGTLYVSPAPAPRHQRLVQAIFIVLDAYGQPHGGEAFVSPIDVVFSQTNAVEPDVIYVGPDRGAIVGEQYVSSAPSLVVEVLSPSSSEVDPGEKLRLYALNRVPEYQIADPKTQTIVAHADPQGERYARIVHSADGAIESLTLLDLRFSFIEHVRRR